MLRVSVILLLCCTLSDPLFAQRGFGRRFNMIQPDQPLQGDPTEWVFARLAYSGSATARSNWTVDYPAAEFHFSEAVRRLTRIDTHERGHVVSPDSDQLFDYPWLYAVEVGSWDFTDSQAQRMREYFSRGGFLMVDDFHGEYEWASFLTGMRRILPAQTIEDIPADDPVYAMPYPITERLQVPGPQYMWTGVTYERTDGVTPHWRGIRDERGRWMVVIAHNIDYGEGWEQANTPQYPEPYTRQAYEVGINYLIYSMSH
jgi:hypothetical protein